MTLPTLLATNLAIVLACMLALWLLSVPLRNASIVDIFWGPGFGIVAVATLLLIDGYEPRQWLLTVMTVAWALRLGTYLAFRNIGHGEDSRYAKWRDRVDSEGGNFVVRSLFMVFGLQGLLMWTVSLPVQTGQAATAPAALGVLAWLGAVLWLIGFLFEAIGDWQLSRFKADPANKGQVLDSGLWRYTRHPNYFGNACIWWGIWLVAADAGAWWTVFSPILMTFLLLKVSGVALLEKSMQETKPKYQDYVERTSAFFPLPPKQSSSD